MLYTEIYDDTNTFAIKIEGRKITLNEICFVVVFAKSNKMLFSTNTDTFWIPEDNKTEVWVFKNYIMIAIIKDKK
jgi:hypothetical protein